MSATDKLYFISAYFDELEVKINRLQTLEMQSMRDEATILCLVYIDHLASGNYFDGTEKNKEHFCRVLRELSGDPLFSTIHPRFLVELASEVKSAQPIVPLIESYVSQNPDRFFDEDEIRQLVLNSPLPTEIKNPVINGLWKASTAALCYQRLRCPAIHGPGTMDLSFSKTAYEGDLGTTLDFERLYGALQSIFRAVRANALSTSHWFGNPLYRSGV
jgi:hypothetical protein